VRQSVKKNKSTAWKILGQPVPISGKPQNRAHADLVGVPNPKFIARRVVRAGRYGDHYEQTSHTLIASDAVALPCLPVSTTHKIRSVICLTASPSFSQRYRTDGTFRPRSMAIC
jgi:hypothetical protein